MSDYYNASGVPAFKASLASSTIRAEFLAVNTGISDKLPTLSGMGDRIVKVNAGGTALESVASLGIAQGGTGAATEAAARTALGVAIGTDVQAHSARLAEIAALAPTDSNVIVGNGSAWVAETGATARASLGLGTLATLSTINNSQWSGTELAVANGGTGASEAATARSNLGLGTLATLSTINNSQWSGTELAVANGGTGASDAATARSNLGAAAASHNHSAANITSGTLAVARGGTGQTTMDNLSEQVVLQWTIQADPGGTPSGSPGDVFAYY